MKAAMLGLGKLGMPVSCGMVQKGHEVFGYEIDAKKRANYRNGVSNLWEPDMDAVLKKAQLSSPPLHIVDSVQQAVNPSEIVFVAVPTPSRPDHSFDTSYVETAVSEIGKSLKGRKDYVTVVIISTVLPGTIREKLAPALEWASAKKVGVDVGLVYNASFIAMGTTIGDYLTPEFVLIGESDPRAGHVVEQFYKQILPSSIARLHMSWDNAETVKMAYNTMIGFKIVYANTLMELCHNLPSGDVDVVSDALAHATVRVVGPKYLRGGMGDAGACHPRDNLALGWLGRKLSLSANPFEFIMEAREHQAAWLGSLLVDTRLPIVLMGERYKPNTNLTDGSAGLLVKEILEKSQYEVLVYDPITKPDVVIPDKPHAFLLCLDEEFVKLYPYPKGSVVVDPWRCLLHGAPQGVAYVPVGVGPKYRVTQRMEKEIQVHT